MQDVLISVVIPTYNAETTIDRCLESVVNQTHTNLQILCCDDCSKDGTWAKLTEWAQKDARITIMQNETNSRAAFSRNRCIENAEGVFIAQIDDDDYCALDRLEKQAQFLLEHEPYDFVGTGAYYFDESGIWGHSKRTEGYAPRAEDFLWNAVFLNPSMMYRSEALKAVGGYRIAKETRRGQDYDLHMRLYAAGYRAYVLPDKLTYYYRGKNSFPKCKYEYRIDECKIRFKNFKALGLLPKGIPYAIKPLLVGLVPIEYIERFKRIKNQKQVEHKNEGK